MQPGISAHSKGTWELGGFGGGVGVASHAPDTEFLVVGGRLRRIVTADHFPGWRRGNFEIAGELMRDVCRFYSTPELSRDDTGEEHLRREGENHSGPGGTLRRTVA